MSRIGKVWKCSGSARIDKRIWIAALRSSVLLKIRLCDLIFSSFSGRTISSAVMKLGNKTITPSRSRRKMSPELKRMLASVSSISLLFSEVLRPCYKSGSKETFFSTWNIPYLRLSALIYLNSKIESRQVDGQNFFAAFLCTKDSTERTDRFRFARLIFVEWHFRFQRWWLRNWKSTLLVDDHRTWTAACFVCLF